MRSRTVSRPESRWRCTRSSPPMRWASSWRRLSSSSSPSQLTRGRICVAMLQHVTLEVRRDQGEECADFYELLGFKRVTPPESLRDRALWLQSGATQIHLMYVEEPVTMPRGHVAVVLDDYDRRVEALRAAGFEVELRARHWGAPRAYVHDPAGGLVEVMAYAPPG